MGFCGKVKFVDNVLLRSMLKISGKTVAEALSALLLSVSHLPANQFEQEQRN
jgi:hypothetical protein